MNNQDILTRAIEKAIAGGFYEFAGGLFGKPEFIVASMDKFGHTKIWVKDWPDEWVSAEHIIFSHDFTKALWGDKLVHTEACRGNYCSNLVAYKFHLQQMVIADDPIAYLGDNI